MREEGSVNTVVEDVEEGPSLTEPVAEMFVDPEAGRHDTADGEADKGVMEDSSTGETLRLPSGVSLKALSSSELCEHAPGNELFDPRRITEEEEECGTADPGSSPGSISQERADEELRADKEGAKQPRAPGGGASTSSLKKVKARQRGTKGSNGCTVVAPRQFDTMNKEQAKMSEWVAVCADEEEEPVEIPTEGDGSMLLTSVTAQFPGATGLKFRNPSTNTVRGVRMQGEVLYPPSEEGWGRVKYICVRPQQAARRGEPRLKRKMKSDIPEVVDLEPESKVKKEVQVKQEVQVTCVLLVFLFLN